MVRTLRPGVVGAGIVAVRTGEHDVVRPAGFGLNTLVGRRVAAVERRAKRILLRLEPEELAAGPAPRVGPPGAPVDTLGVHLGMTGQLRLATPGDELAKHTHVVLSLCTGREVRFIDARRFGGLRWFGPAAGDDGLGPEPLTMRPGQLAAPLARTRRALKTALLDQQVVAGLGNIYVDEALFAARIHPLTPANTLSRAQIGGLSRAIKTTLAAAIAAGGSTLRDYVDAAGRAGGFQDCHKVYGRTGEPCRRCRTRIERLVIGGRSTHVCPQCQRSRDDPHR